MSGFQYTIGFLFKDDQHVDKEQLFALVSGFFKAFVEAGSEEPVSFEWDRTKYAAADIPKTDNEHRDIRGIFGFAEEVLYSFCCILETPPSGRVVFSVWDDSRAAAGILREEGDLFCDSLAGTLLEKWRLERMCFATDDLDMEMREVLERNIQTQGVHLLQGF